jgi:hypothetical protein
MIDHQDLDAVRAWFAAHKGEIIRDYAAEGAGVGRSRTGGGYAITVYLASDDKRPLAAVVRDGVPLQFEVTGKLRPQ